MCKRSYGYLALNDYKYIVENIKSKGGHSLKCVELQQVSERILKHVIYVEMPSYPNKTDILHTHSIHGLVRCLSTKYDTSLLRNLSNIDNVYFNCRYPSGTNFTPDDDYLKDCLEYTQNCIKWLFTFSDINTVFDLYKELTGVEEVLSSRHTREFLLDMSDLEGVRL